MTNVFADEINKEGGVMLSSCGKKLPLKIIIYDDQSNPSLATSLYEKMASVDNVDFFVGPDWTTIALPVATVAEKHKIPMISANVAAHVAYTRGLKYFWGTPYPIVPRWSENYFAMLSTMNPKPKTIFFITQDNPVQKEITDTWAPKAEAAGMHVVGKEIFPTDLKDFSSIIFKLREAKPDIIYISSFDNASVALLQQMRQQRVHALDVHQSILSGSLAHQVGDNVVEGMTSEIAWYHGIKGDYGDLVERVFKYSDIDMFENLTSMARFVSYLVMTEAIEKAGAVDHEKVRAALYKGTFKAPPGDVTFDENGFPSSTDFTIQMQKGKVIVVWPAAQATGKMIWPSPSWQ
jgi:ABC-type branched-subunit amino acid transport system substrate-binding protein